MTTAVITQDDSIAEEGETAGATFFDHNRPPFTEVEPEYERSADV